MNKLTFTITLLLIIGIHINPILSQNNPVVSLRLHLQPQVSSLNPYDPGFISDENRVAPSMAFGIEATKNLSDKFELSIGYSYSSQAGNYSLVECDRALNFNAIFDPITDNVGNRLRCPMPRGKIRLTKIPIALGWRFFEKDRFMSRISAGPQFQLLLNPPRWGLYNYKKVSAAFMLEISSYYKLTKHLSLVAGLRADRGLTPLDHNALDRSIGNSLGLLVGIEYTYWSDVE